MSEIDEGQGAPAEGQEGNQGGEGGQPADQNLKAEMNRKFQNYAEQLAQTNQQLAQVLQSLTASKQQAAPAAPTRPLKDLVFDNPDEFVKTIVAQAEQRASQIIDNKVNATNQASSVIMEVQNKFPEFADANSEASKYAIQYANTKLPQHLKGTPEGVKLAMMEAASQFDLVPAGKRGQYNAKNQGDPDSFVSGAASSGNQPSRRTRGDDPAKKISQDTLDIAALMGIDTSDPKRIESLAKHAQRKNWNRYT